MPTTTSQEPVELSDEHRRALLDELFALHREKSPDSHLCFCGSDGELVDTVTKLRAERELERERERDDEPEL